MKTVTRAILSDRMSEKTGVTRQLAVQILESTIKHMIDSLSRGQSVKISGFGTFNIRHKKQRIGRNPKTGRETPILPRAVLTFHASQLLKDRLVKTTSNYPRK